MGPWIATVHQDLHALSLGHTAFAIHRLLRLRAAVAARFAGSIMELVLIAASIGVATLSCTTSQRHFAVAPAFSSNRAAQELAGLLLAEGRASLELL
jgi:hypothetical protein